MSILENIIAALQTRLEAITVAGGYSQTVASVQRYRNTLDQNERLGNSFRAKPVILLRFNSEAMTEEGGTIGLTEPSAEVEIIYLLDDSADDADVVAAVADVKKALGDWSAMALVGALVQGFRVEVVDPETHMAHDGIRFYVDFEYAHDFGDPSQRTG